MGAWFDTHCGFPAIATVHLSDARILSQGSYQEQITHWTCSVCYKIISGTYLKLRLRNEPRIFSDGNASPRPRPGVRPRRCGNPRLKSAKNAGIRTSTGARTSGGKWISRTLPMTARPKTWKPVRRAGSSRYSIIEAMCQRHPGRLLLRYKTRGPWGRLSNAAKSLRHCEF